MLPIDLDRLQKFLTALLQTPSPTGFADEAIEYVRQNLPDCKTLQIHLTRKGGLLVRWPGKQPGHPRALSAHVDTLGAMVKEIKPNGRLRLFQVGGYAWNSIEGEGCQVFTTDGRVIRGTILMNKSSVHVYGKEASEARRDEESMEIRLDERVHHAEDTAALGVRVGDFVAFDPRVEWVHGFIRSRHLDDKAGAACVVEAARTLMDAGEKPAGDTYLFFSNYEEVGHGAASGIPTDVEELVSVDMAAVGDGQTSDEFHTTVCLSDSSGPYHRGLSNRLIRLAEENHIPIKTDIYPHYGSDGSAFLRAGGNAAVALIGPGVDASHHYERTHMDALTATTQLILAYLLQS